VHNREMGPIEYDWAAVRVVDSRQRLPVDDVWLLARRSVTEPTEVAWSLSNAPVETSLATLAHVASTCCVIEQLFGETRDDVGLDHYEVRSWPAWHRHITLAVLAHTIRTQLAAAHPVGARTKRGAYPSPSGTDRAVVALRDAPLDAAGTRVAGRESRGALCVDGVAPPSARTGTSKLLPSWWPPSAAANAA
jgi:hypothetical protein